MPTQKEGREIPNMEPRHDDLAAPAFGICARINAQGDGNEQHQKGCYGNQLKGCRHTLHNQAHGWFSIGIGLAEITVQHIP